MDDQAKPDVEEPIAMKVGEDGRVELSDEVAAESAIPREELARMTDDIIAALKTVRDPEIPQTDIYEIGLIYRIDIEDDRMVKVEMTLTAPACPFAEQIVRDTHEAVSSVEGVMDADVALSFDPPWTPDRMSEEAQIALGWY